MGERFSDLFNVSYLDCVDLLQFGVFGFIAEQTDLCLSLWRELQMEIVCIIGLGLSSFK